MLNKMHSLWNGPLSLLLTRSAFSSTSISLGGPSGYDDGHATTSLMGSYQPNHFGLYDMSSNTHSVG